MSEPRSVSLHVKYQLGHSIHETWAETDLYCPFCGKRGIWQETGTGGDYYHGVESICPACGRTQCCLPATVEADLYPSSPEQEQRVQAIRQAMEPRS